MRVLGCRKEQSSQPQRNQGIEADATVQNHTPDGTKLTEKEMVSITGIYLYFYIESGISLFCIEFSKFVMLLSYLNDC